MMDEHVGSAVIGGDKTKALFSAKPFYCTYTHCVSLYLYEARVYLVLGHIANEIGTYFTSAYRKDPAIRVNSSIW